MPLKISGFLDFLYYILRATNIFWISHVKWHVIVCKASVGVCVLLCTPQTQCGRGRSRRRHHGVTSDHNADTMKSRAITTRLCTLGVFDYRAFVHARRLRSQGVCVCNNQMFVHARRLRSLGVCVCDHQLLVHTPAVLSSTSSLGNYLLSTCPGRSDSWNGCEARLPHDFSWLPLSQAVEFLVTVANACERKRDCHVILADFDHLHGIKGFNGPVVQSKSAGRYVTRPCTHPILQPSRSVSIPPWQNVSFRTAPWQNVQLRTALWQNVSSRI